MTTHPRRLLIMGLPGLLAGCGFRPVYGTGARATAMQADLGAVSVALIPNRPGQLLRQALQQRLEGSEGGQLKRYELTVGYSVAQDNIGIQRDTTFSRLRQTATAQWSLRALDPASTLLTSGTNRALDGANVIDQQYFAADIESDTAQARLAIAIADQIALEVAAFFRRRTPAA